ncbi:MAG TPA: 30S ribosomal protein S8 [Candidatus Moranbacteria bacterium]|nr:30S ribosomal protein S8 [Candidatus Moranbacteria bacterium]
MLDPISDMLTRIRNAQRARHNEVAVPFSKLKMSIAKILEQRNFIDSVKQEENDGKQIIKIALKYETVSNTEKNPAIREIRRVSHQGQRIYVRKSGIKRVKNGYGISIISTSKGIMTGDEAKKSGFGGEVIW